MGRILFVAAVSLMCILCVSAQQHNVDTQKSTLTIHIGKTGVFSGLDTSMKCARRFTVVQQRPARTLQSKSTWMRGSCA